MANSQIIAKRKAQWRLRMLVILLASLPLLLAVVAVVWSVGDLITTMQANQVRTVQSIVLKARKDELKHFVQAGSKVMAHYCSPDNGPIKLSREGRELLRHMDFGDLTDDNYFFIYTMDGVNVMHPRLPKIEGTSLWEFKDAAGHYIIQDLIEHARSGDHFWNYVWHRPSTDKIEPKLGYVEYVPECNLMIGTGLYLDYMKEIDDLIRTQTKEAIDQTRDQIVLIALACLLLVAAGGLMLNLHEQRQANQKLRRMAQQVVESQEAERTRVARDLHDGVSQWLAATKFTFETARLQMHKGNLEKSTETLSGGVEKLQSVMRYVREMSHKLRSAMLDDAGLGPTVEQESREFGERTGIQMEVQIGDMPTLSKDVESDLYRTFQEATRNIEKHAAATRIHIAIQQDKAGLWMRIHDNGVGTPDTARRQKGGIGLINMRERIERHGGEFAFEPAPGDTRVTAFIPHKHL
jgi:two-component system NarL family sensor kinase